MHRRAKWNLRLARLLVAGGGLLLAVQSASAAHPQATIGTGLHTASDGFSEQFNVGFGFSIPTPMPAPGHSGVVGLTPQGTLAPSISYNPGDSLNTPIPFAGGGTAPAAQTGFALTSPSGTAFFTLSATQSNSRSLGGQMGSVTVMDGGTGFISDSSLVPFVTSFVPVVGDNSGGSSVLGERLARLKAGDTGGVRGNPNAGFPPAAGNGNAAGNGAANGPAAQQALGDAAVPLGLQVAAANPTAGQGVASVAEIRAQQAAADETAAAEFRQLFAQAQGAARRGQTERRENLLSANRRGGPPAPPRQQALAALKSLAVSASSSSKSAAPLTETPANDGQAP